MRNNETQWLVCPCNTISDFPSPCPYHDTTRLETITLPTQHGWTFQIGAWECPRCKKINAPHTNQCTCKGEE